jgi:hypothetical protein
MMIRESAASASKVARMSIRVILIVLAVAVVFIRAF